MHDLVGLLADMADDAKGGAQSFVGQREHIAQLVVRARADLVEELQQVVQVMFLGHECIVLSLRGDGALAGVTRLLIVFGRA